MSQYSRDILSEEEKWRKKMKKRKLKEAKIEAMDVDEEEQGMNEMLERKEEDEIKLKVEILGEQPDKISPIVGYFPSGFDPLKKQHGPPPEIRVFRNTKRTQRLQLVVTPNQSQVDFIGHSHSSEIAAGSQCNYALGVLDKETGILKIVPIASNKIFRLEPKIQGLDESDKGPAKEELTEDKKAHIQRERLLMYETKRAINKDKKKDAIYKKDDPSTQENMEVKLKKIKINKEVLESAGSQNYRNIPFHDVNATTPDSAYPLDKIILNSDWDFLIDVLEYVQSGEGLTQYYPTFVRNRAHKLPSIKDDFEKSKIAGLFSFITHLIKFKDKHSFEGASSAKNHIIPAQIYQRFNSLFAESDSKRLLDEKRNLLISHVLVLTLFADDFKSDMADIAKDLRMTAVELRRHFENLGCKLKREGTALWATLPVPLTFPQIKGKRRNNK
ncbi:DNA-directed RNA polymerase I subunit RPA49 [Impatiens glandulifera]|uniref:DNA-directed RNA polymerase I subunit RPA49 n=1 Tax=Impatiens glandulifera TaxID=253017 RepID=UPI001FB125E4|nr:DNA-directed RNA polymerase I subunit RPA49 [Impatiens glandulifera]